MALLLQTVIIGSVNNKCSSGSTLHLNTEERGRSSLLPIYLSSAVTTLSADIDKWALSQNNWLKEIKRSKSSRDVSNLLIENKERGVQLNERRGG